jgi:hypothetical protein
MWCGEKDGGGETVLDTTGFQFQCGTVKRQKKACGISIKNTFQFQCGAVKRGAKVGS